MGNGQCSESISCPLNFCKKTKKPMPIQTMFKLPYPLPTWPPGESFARGTIDLGGIEVCEISSFTKVWATHEGGPDNLGATFFEPSPIPDGFFMLGCYGQPNNAPLFGWVLAAKDVTNDPSGEILKQPIDYTLYWSSESLKIKQDGNGYIWLPTPPDGYKAIGHVVTSSPEKPSLNKIRCVRADFTDVCENDSWIWGQDNQNFDAYGLRPTSRGIQALGVPTGTFIAQNGGGASPSLSCKIGEHVGDWEHVTLRVSNFNGELKSVYFSEHNGGRWVSAPELEFQGGSDGIGIRNDTAKSKMVMNTGERFLEVAAEYLGSEIVEPPWLNYAREWGPKIEYDIEVEIKMVEKLLPGKLKKMFDKFIRSIPSEVLGEEGPTGPKMKNNWSGDEN
ncbi:hypothetical protein HYC85_016794 [Camellia sinensis]|uniref:Vacuolar protein sorting-associated protein 62 n=1 Tax=Camellia sinensis TaxID=4442 RepID=A0A7J7H4C0_CAMSI|nr:hypothetical protein HYC85_016794 [Camellia sinensis]